MNLMRFERSIGGPIYLSPYSISRVTESGGVAHVDYTLHGTEQLFSFASVLSAADLVAAIDAFDTERSLKYKALGLDD